MMNRAGNHPTTAAMSCPETLGEVECLSPGSGSVNKYAGANVATMLRRA